MTGQRLRAGYDGTFVVECLECGRDTSFADPNTRSGECPNVEITYHDEVSIECGESELEQGFGAKIHVTGFDVVVNVVDDGEDR